MQTTRFHDLLLGIDSDPEALRRDLRAIRPADRSYVILFSARSGSSWLTSLLSGTGRLGRPEEYLNPNFVVGQARAMNAGTPRHLLKMLQRRCKTDNGVFGLEARSCDIRQVGVEVFRSLFAAKAIFFHLWRDNLVAQGVSLYRAVATGRYHSNSPSGSPEPPDYDPTRISLWLNHVAGTENDNASMLLRLGVPARHLCYERIVADRAATLALFARVLGEDLPPASLQTPAAGELGKIGDTWNLIAEQRFRADHADLIAQIEAARLVKHGIEGQAPSGMPDAPDLARAWTDGHHAGANGSSPFQPPELADAPLQSWHNGWRAGWNDQPILAPATHVRLVEPVLPPELPDDRLRSFRQPVPRALHDYTAQRLIELLADQARRGLPGGLLEIGLSRGRQTALLLAAPRTEQTRVMGLDLLDGSLAGLLRGFLVSELGDRKGFAWVANITAMNDVTPAQLQQIIGGPARFVAIDAAQAPERLADLLALGANVLEPSGCLIVSDFMRPKALAVTEAVFAFLAATPDMVPFALLPGRLMLARRAASPRYHEMIKAFALRDRVSPISLRLHDALARGDVTRLEQTLSGQPTVVLS